MPTINSEYLKDTPILDFDNELMAAFVEERGWKKLDEYQTIGAIYNFVRDEIRFGYNRSDDIPASEVLLDGYGQCNTKGTLLMALLRAVSIPCRIHGFTIHKSLQRGVVPELVYPIAPDNILHSWVEVLYEGEWFNLEGFILDKCYLSRLQEVLGVENKSLCSYGVGTEDLSNPEINWCGGSTYIQKTGINSDLGVFASPDEFYAHYHQEFPLWKRWVYEYIVRHWMNARVEKMRNGKMVPRSYKSPLGSTDWKFVVGDE